MTIRRLSEDVFQRIAAGEVIERPVSVCKELLENALDAGASRISVTLLQGGKTSLIVEDDGCGIPFDELPLALERHATSKIFSLEDLDRIGTLGFRGEALASIATVSLLEIRSRATGEDRGGMIRSEGGSVVLHQPLPCPEGTRIQVEELFFNLPARRKFLRAPGAETRRVGQLIQEMGLIHPEVRLTLRSEGRVLFDTEPGRDTERALRDHWGCGAARSLSVSSGGVEAELWWSGPKEGRTPLVLFANGRRIQDSSVRGALLAGAGTCGGDWLVVLRLPPEDLDVNVHPAKTEVRFRRPGEVFDLVRRGVAKLVEGGTFGDHWVLPGVPDLSSPPPSGEPYRERTFPASPGPTLPSWDRAFPQRVAEPRTTGAPRWGSPFPPLGRGEGAPSSRAPSLEPEAVYLGQAQRGYLLFDGPSGLWVLDPHAAQERILYERLRDSWGRGTVQSLAVPVDLPGSLAPTVESCRRDLEGLGFRFQAPPQETPEGWKVTGIPHLLALYPLAPLDWLRLALAEEGVADPATLVKRVADRACKASLKLGERLQEEEARTLLRDLRACETPYACPHGRPTLFTLSWEEIASRLGRSSS